MLSCNIDMLGTIISFILAVVAILTFIQTQRINRKNQFFQIYNEVLKDEKFRLVCQDIETKYSLKENDTDFDYMLKLIQNLFAINKKLTIKYFQRQLLLITFYEPYYKYISECNDEVLGSIYTPIHKYLDDFKRKMFIIGEKRDFEYLRNLDSTSNYYKALKNYEKELQEWKNKQSN